jgi:hypothetical protein
MKAKKLDKSEFARAIKLGLGRALLHVKEYGDSGVENELLNACLHNLVYDSQIEDGRSWWLMQMLVLTRNIDFYAGKIKEALLNEDGPDFNQLVVLAVKLFDQGFAEFKGVLSNLGPRNVNGEGLRVLGEALVQLNGFAGLKAGAILMQENSIEPWEKLSFYQTSMDNLNDARGVTDFLETEAKDCALVADFLQEINSEMEQRKQKFPPSEPWTIAQVLNDIENAFDSQGANHRSFGRYATHEELLTIVERLEGAEKPNQQYGYLSVFGNRALPIVTPKVKNLLTSNDKNVRRAARNALSLVKSLTVRNLALDTIRRGDDESIAYGLAILQLNFQPEDSELILHSLRKVKGPDFLHWSGSAVRHIADSHSDTAVLADCLLLLYEIDPCGICRGRALEQLMACNLAPKELIYEMQWDANRDNRITARGVAVPEF